MDTKQISLLNCGVVPPTKGAAVPQNMMDVQAVQNFVKKQKRVQGFTWNVPVGQTPFNVNLSGKGKLLLGFVLMDTQSPLGAIAATSCNLVVNNDQVVMEANPNSFGISLTDEEFYYFPRPLNGSDDIVMTITSGVVTQISATFYYI